MASQSVPLPASSAAQLASRVNWEGWSIWAGPVAYWRRPFFLSWCDTPLSAVSPANANATQSSQIEGILCRLLHMLCMPRVSIAAHVPAACLQCQGSAVMLLAHVAPASARAHLHRALMWPVPPELLVQLQLVAVMVKALPLQKSSQTDITRLAIDGYLLSPCSCACKRLIDGWQ